MTIDIDSVDFDIVIDEHSYELSRLALDCVMESIAAKFITLKTVYSALLQCLIDSGDNMLMSITVVRVFGQNVEQVLTFVILLPNDGVICCL